MTLEHATEFRTMSLPTHLWTTLERHYRTLDICRATEAAAQASGYASEAQAAKAAVLSVEADIRNVKDCIRSLGSKP